MRELKSVIKDTFNNSRSDKLKVFQEKLIFTKYKILGVKTEVVKKLAKEIVKEDFKDISEYLEKPSFSSYEELTLYGFILSYISCDVDVKIKYLSRYLEYVDNWASCDLVCSSFKEINKNKEFFFNYFCNLVKSHLEYQRRFAIVAFLNYFLSSNYIDNILYIIKNIKDDRFYVKKAIAWLIATALSKEWNKTIKLIENKELDKWIHNNSIQKAIESYRITKEQKEYLRTLKIK